MAATADLLAQTERLRRQTLDLLSQMEEHGQRLGLPPFPDVLQMCREKLQENIYRVLVVGEAKRGKSSFINALLGRDLLPVDVDVATCQVFRIRRAAQEAYRLRFEDDSEQVIRAEDLPRYGSQVLADLNEIPRLDQIIRWIEVDVPAPFLPPNLWLLDTPGLGSLYAFHARITYRFVPECDGVVYVLDSQAPISQPELQFIEDLLKVTNHLFFIQTKIDLFDQDAWQKILQRNEDILRQRFGDQLGQVRVWPVSNQLLRKASETQDEDYLEASKYKELSEALQLFLYRIAGLVKTRATAALGIEHHRSCQQVLQQRLDNLKMESKEKQKELHQQLRKLREQMETDCGPHGQKRREFLEKVQQVCNAGRQHIHQELQKILSDYQRKVEQLPLEEVEKEGSTIFNEMVTEVSDLWKRTVSDTQQKLAQHLGEFIASLPAGPVLSTVDSASPPARDTNKFSEMMSDVGKVIKGAGMGALVGAAAFLGANVILATGFFATIGALISGLLGIKSAAAFGSIVGGLGSLWNLFKGKKAKLEAAKQELRARLDRAWNQIHYHYLGPSGVVEQSFEMLKNQAEEQIDKLVQQELQKREAEIQRLEKDAQLQEQARRERIQEVREQLADWDKLGQELQNVRNELHGLERILAAA
jgi:ribosome biogenesis GTPase A